MQVCAFLMQRFANSQYTVLSNDSSTLRDAGGPTLSIAVGRITVRQQKASDVGNKQQRSDMEDI
jgi:hypothetical protein